VGLVEEVLKGLDFDLMEQIKIQYIPDLDQLTSVTKKIEEGIV